MKVGLPYQNKYHFFFSRNILFEQVMNYQLLSVPQSTL